jgi:hypothetical protein
MPVAPCFYFKPFSQWTSGTRAHEARPDTVGDGTLARWPFRASMASASETITQNTGYSPPVF